MVKFYIITHKRFDRPKYEEFEPIQVGAEGKEKIGYLVDSIGDNISAKNKNYCELTGIYWIWKNDKNTDIVGINHYRRYFVKACGILRKRKLLSAKEAEMVLNHYDIILPKKEPLKESAWEEYTMVSGLEKDLITVKSIIESDYPDMLQAFEKYFSNNQSHLYNMMICRKEIFDEYCTFLFDVLAKLEKTVDYKLYNDYQKRIYGFMSERLLNVWCLYKKLKVKEFPVVNTEMSNKEKVRIFLRRYKNRVIWMMRKGVMGL